MSDNTVTNINSQETQKEPFEDCGKGEYDVFYTMDDGKEYCDEELALSVLLREEVLFCNTRTTTDAYTTVVLFVACNDTFAWGVADAEPFTTVDIPDLYKAWHSDKEWGVDKWCCIRRNEKPQKPIVEAMKNSGSWDTTMESLPGNVTDLTVKKQLTDFVCSQNQQECSTG